MQTHCLNCREEFQPTGWNAPDAKHPKYCALCVANELFECADCGELAPREGSQDIHIAGRTCADCCEEFYPQEHGASERADFTIKEMKEAA